MWRSSGVGFRLGMKLKSKGWVWTMGSNVKGWS